MTIDREAVYVALFTWLQSKLAGQFVTMGRRHIMPPELGPEQQPALFVCGVKESRNPQPRGTGGKLTLSAMLFIYCYQSAANAAPGEEESLAATQINALLRKIDAALTPVRTIDGVDYPDPQGVLTLNDVVVHCELGGDTDIDPGIFGQQAAAIASLHILVP